MSDEELEQAFPLTAEDLRVIARFPDANPETWKEFAGSIQPHLLSAYADQDIDFKQLAELTRKVSVGCTIRQRIWFLSAGGRFQK